MKSYKFDKRKVQLETEYFALAMRTVFNELEEARNDVNQSSDYFSSILW